MSGASQSRAPNEPDGKMGQARNEPNGKMGNFSDKPDRRAKRTRLKFRKWWSGHRGPLARRGWGHGEGGAKTLRGAVFRCGGGPGTSTLPRPVTGTNHQFRNMSHEPNGKLGGSLPDPEDW